jgi:hypothetical protein
MTASQSKIVMAQASAITLNAFSGRIVKGELAREKDAARSPSDLRYL